MGQGEPLPPSLLEVLCSQGLMFLILDRMEKASVTYFPGK